MASKRFDLFMNILRNPDATVNDFALSGLDTSNTMLKDKEAYLNSEKVRSALTNSSGLFDLAAFDKMYDSAVSLYNMMSGKEYQQAMEDQILFHRDDIFAPIEKRRVGPEFELVRVSNPYEQTSSIIEFGKIGPRDKSIDELAQSKHVLLNPTTAGDNLENAKWGISPNDGFGEYFFDTLVLAQYDSDGEHKDPISGEIVKHKKGDLRLDPNGHFYYEKLDGRDIYGRRVLNKMNVITTDGSWLNQYDFFDSDDIKQKSIGGSIMKNLALVGSMFIPYVGPWITGLSVASQLAGMGATLGKMLVGSDSPTLSAIEGWSKSVSRQGAVTEEAANNTWCWENYINLIGDVVGLLKEQRFIFEKLPAAIKGTNIATKEGQAIKRALIEELVNKLQNQKIADLAKSKLGLAEIQIAKLKINAETANIISSELNSFIKGYRKIGDIFGKGYMTALTVSDTYGEAKQAGASDLDATLLTLGYAAGEYALLNTGIGEALFPELRVNRYKYEAISKAFAQKNQVIGSSLKDLTTGLKNIPKENKKLYVLKMFNLGKSIARAEYATGAKTAKATLAAGVGEGLEEVSEELLADFSKGCYNVVNWLAGKDTRLSSFGYDPTTGEFNLKDIIDRYGMSLLGGFVGGGITNLGTNYLAMHDLGNINSKTATELLVYMARNGELDLFLKTMNKMLLGDKNLSATKIHLSEDGTINFAPGTETDNLDVYIKKVITLQANIVKQILESNGGFKSDDEFLSKATFDDIKFQSLFDSAAAGGLINEYNNLNSDIIRLTSQINGIYNKAADTNNDGTVTDAEKRENTTENKKIKLSDTDKVLVKQLESDLKEKLLQLLDLLDGKRSYEFIADALFEMTPALSGVMAAVTLPLFAEQYYHRKWSDLSDLDKAKAKVVYDKWKTSTGRETVKEASNVFRNILYSLNSTLQKHAKEIENIPQEVTKTTQALNNVFQLLITPELLKSILKLYGEDGSKVIPDDVLNSLRLLTAQESVGTSPTTTGILLLRAFGNLAGVDLVKAIIDKKSKIDPKLSTEEFNLEASKIEKEAVNKLHELLILDIDKYVTPFINAGFANNTTKNQLLNLLGILRNYAQLLLNQADEDIELGYITDELYKLTVNALTHVTNLGREVSKLLETPIEKNLNEIAISLGLDPINLTQLLQLLQETLYDSSQDISRFVIGDVLYQLLENAIHTMQIYRAAVLASRTDNTVTVNNLFGYSATLNEVAKKVLGESYPEVAEIDKDIADPIIADIESNLGTLEFMKQLYDLNRSQKLASNERVATKKNVVAYNRLKALILVPDDDLRDWKGIEELQNIINGLTIHSLLAKDNSTFVSENQKLNFEKEVISLLDAVYNFFQNNKDKLDNVNELAKFLSPRKFLYYTEANELMNENMTQIDDNAFVWWLAGRAAVKASDFYSVYAKVIDPMADKPIAPIATQEMGVFNNYANIINGGIFDKFYLALRKAVTDDWKTRTIDERKKLLENIGKSLDSIDFLSLDNMIDYSLNFLPVPRYSNIVLTEGVPGSGKTLAVIYLTIEMLKRTNPELLNNIYIAHGANISSALKLGNDLKLPTDNILTFGLLELMKLMSAQWREYPIDPVTGKYQIPISDYTYTSEKEIRSNLRPNTNITNIPKIIIIDEISKFSTYDLDIIDNFAKLHGITVIAAGDFDQDGVVGSHSVTINNTSLIWNVSTDRTLFIRTPKLGVSMRTDNTIMSTDLQFLLTYMLNKRYKDPLELHYYEDETGIYGNYVITYNQGIARDEETKAITDLSNSKSIYVNQVLERVDKLIETLKPGLKIGYIYSDQESPIFKELSSEKYAKYIDLKRGSSAQGLEGLYYIIEADFDPDPLVFLKHVYTGISRALQGTIVIVPYNTDDEAGINFVNSVKLNLKTDSSLSKASTAKYANNRKEVLTAITPSDAKIPYIPRVGVAISSTASNNLPEVKGGLTNGVDPTPPPTTEPPLNKVRDEIINRINNATSENEINSIIDEYKSQFPEVTTDKDIDSAKQAKINQLKNPLPEIQIVSFDTIPEDKKKDILDAVKAAKGNPQITDGYDTNDENSDIKYGDIVKVLNDDKYLVVVGIKNGDGTRISSYETLDPESRVSNNIWGFDTSVRFRNAIEALIKPPAEKEPEVKPPLLIYEDDISPITNTDIIEDSDYLGKIDTSNEGTELPKAKVISSDNTAIRLSLLGYSFNTFELGVTFDSDGNIVSPRGDKRIDSINGLVKIDLYLNRPVSNEEEYKLRIGNLRNIIFNTEEKAKLCERLLRVLGLQNIYCTFALKSIPRPSLENRERDRKFVSSKVTDFSIFDKSIDEEVLYTGSSDSRSKEWRPKVLEIIIGSESTGDILELPLISLSSPLTLMRTADLDGNYPFTEVNEEFNKLLDSTYLLSKIQELINRSTNNYEKTFLNNLLNNVRSKGPTIHAACEVIARVYTRHPKFKYLANLFTLYNLTDSAIFYMDDPNWTVAKDLQLLGPLFITRRGLDYFVDGFEYDLDGSPEEEWINVAEFTKRPDCYVTKNIYVSRTGKVDSNSGHSIDIANAGHPFVLVSFDKSLNDDASVIRLYKALLEDNSVKKKIKLVYILPPKFTTREYLDNLHKILNRDPAVLNIGQLFTSYKLLNILMKDNDFRVLLSSRNPGLVDLVDNALNELNSLLTTEERKDKLYETRDWSGVGLSSKPLKLAGLFDGVLVSAGYDLNTLNAYIGETNYSKANELNINLMVSILEKSGVDGVRANVKIPKTHETVAGLEVPIQSEGYVINGKPCKIHGKIDSYEYQVNLDSFIESCLNKLRPNGELHRYSTDTQNYIKHKSNLNERKSKLLELVDKTINYIKAKTGISNTSDEYSRYLSYFLLMSYNNAIHKVAEDINKSTTENIAIVINGLLKISSDKLLSKGAKVLLLNGTNLDNDITSIVYNDGIAKFTLVVSNFEGNTEYSAEYDTNTGILTLIPPVKQTELVVNNIPSINEGNYNSLIAELRTTLEQLSNDDPDVKELLQQDNINDFEAFLQNEWIYIGEERIKDLEGYKGSSTLVDKFIDELIAFERTHNPDEKKDNTDLVCPINIQIK